ncbi:MAG: hypothetical protein ACO3SN_08600 [Burkholderiaceae bacterium]
MATANPKAKDNQGVEYQGGGFFCDKVISHPKARRRISLIDRQVRQATEPQVGVREWGPRSLTAPKGPRFRHARLV